MKTEIEKNIPLPFSKPKEQTRYPWIGDLVSGDSVWFKDESNLRSFRSSFRNAQRRGVTGLEIYTRRVGDDDQKGRGFRAWFVDKQNFGKSDDL